MPEVKRPADCLHTLVSLDKYFYPYISDFLTILAMYITCNNKNSQTISVNDTIDGFRRKIIGYSSLEPGKLTERNF